MNKRLSSTLFSNLCHQPYIPGNPLPSIDGYIVSFAITLLSVLLIFHISDFTELTSLSELIHFLKNLPILRNLSLLTPLLKMSKGNIWRLAQDPSYLVKIPLTQRAIAGLKSTIFLIWCLIFIQYPIMKWIFFNNPSMY